MSLLDAVQLARNEKPSDQVTTTTEDVSPLLNSVQIARKEAIDVALKTQPIQKPKSPFNQIIEFVSNKLNTFKSSSTGQILKQTNPILNPPINFKLKEKPEYKPTKEYFMPTATDAEPARQYIKETAKSAVETIKGAGKLTPAYMMYRAATNKPIKPKEYAQDVLDFGLNVLNLSWRVRPEAPLIGAGLNSWKGVIRYFQGKIDANELIEAPIKGINSQPGFGEVFTDNLKTAQMIDTIFLVTMFITPFAKRKLGEMNLKTQELNKVSEILGVKPNTPLSKVSEVIKREMKKIPDAFTLNPSPESLARRKELTDAYNILKKTKGIDKLYAEAFDFINSKLGKVGIKPPEWKPTPKELGTGVKPEVSEVVSEKKPVAEAITEGGKTEKVQKTTQAKGVVTSKTGNVQYMKANDIWDRTSQDVPPTTFITEKNVAKIMEDMKKNGFDSKKPIEITEYVNQGGLIEISDGNNRLTAAIKLGIEDIPVKIRKDFTQPTKGVEKPQIKRTTPLPSPIKKVSIKQEQKTTPPSKKGLRLEPTKADTEKKVLKEVEELGLDFGYALKRGKSGITYERPTLGRMEVQTILKNSQEFAENPYFVVDKNKDLTFEAEKTKIAIHPESMNLKVENLKVGDKIFVDKDSFKRGQLQLRVKSGASLYASRGAFAELENLTKKLEKQNLKVVEFPEIVRMSRELLGETPKVTATRRGKYLGYFKSKEGLGKGEIVLKAEAFKDSETASKLLAHELGHLTDFPPDLTMKRGNVVGHVATLQRYLKNAYGDLENKVIRKELLDLSAKWRPVEGGTGTASDLIGDSYRASSKELYADAISVLFNDPVRLQQESPEFYKGFFDYLDRKPDAKRVFNETWDLLNQSDEKIFQVRDKELNRSFEEGEKVFANKELEKSKRESSLMYQLNILFNDKNTPIISKIKQLKKKGVTVPSELNPDYALKGLNYYEGELKNYVNKNFQPIFANAQSIPNGWNELGKMVFYERVINERGEMANPQGYNPETARFQLEQMKKTMSPESWAKLQETKGLFREAVQKSVAYAEENGFYSPEMLAMMKANPSYATYQVIDYLDTYISAKVYHSIGTLKDIANPATSTVMKLISVHKAVKRNNAKKLNTEFLKENFPESIQKAKTKWNGKFMEVKDPTDPKYGLVITIEDGKPQGYYVERDIANMLNYVPNPTLDAVARVSRVLTQSRFYRPLFTSFNLGFQSFNFVRDLNRYWKNIPDRNLGEAITSLPRAIVRYGMAVKPSLARVRNRPNEIIQEMENSNILGLTYNDMFGQEQIEQTQQIERVLQKAGVSVIRPSLKKRIFAPFEWVLDKVGDMGNFIETLPKVAGYIELKNKMPEAQLAQFIRTSIGSPDFRVGGSFTPVSNNLFLFSNAIKEGIKTDAGIAFTKNPSRGGFWWKTILSDFLPKILMVGMATGYFGDQLKKQMDGVSEYDKTNYIILPLGFDEKGKTKYLRIPRDETGRFMGGLLWKMIGRSKDADLVESIFDVFSFGAGQFPNLSPSFTGAGALIQYLSGKNPYDSFRGRNIIPETEFAAGFEHSFPIFMSWLAKNQGLGIFFPTYKPDSPTSLEKTLNAPFLSNILGRWIKVSSYGETEKLKKVSARVEKENAIRRLKEREAVDKAIELYKQNPRNKKSIENQLVRNIVGSGPYSGEKQTKKTNLIKKFNIGILRKQSDANLNSLIDANTNAEKVQLLKELKGILSDKEFKEIYNIAKKEKIISDNVIKDFKKLK